MCEQTGDTSVCNGGGGGGGGGGGDSPSPSPPTSAPTPSPTTPPLTSSPWDNLASAGEIVMVSGEDNAAFRQRCMLACDDLSTCAGFALSTCSGAECCVFKSAADVDFFAVDASTFIRRAHASGTGASRSADGADGDAPMTKDEMEAFRDETLEAIAEATKDDDDDDGA